MLMRTHKFDGVSTDAFSLVNGIGGGGHEKVMTKLQCTKNG